MKNSSLSITIFVVDRDEFFCGKEGAMNAEHIAGEIKRMYGFRAPLDDLAQQTEFVWQFPSGTAGFVPALDELVNLVRD